VPPRRVADEVLKLLRAAVLNHGSHRSERGHRRLRQPMQVTPRHRRVVARAGTKEPTVAVDHGCERFRNPVDQGCGPRSSACSYGHVTN